MKKSGSIQARMFGAAVAAFLPSPPTLAAEITQNLPAAQLSGEFTPIPIDGLPFDPSLGSLVSVVGELTGIATPTVLIFPGSNALPPFPPSPVRTNWFVFTSPVPNSFSGTLPDQIVTPTVGELSLLYTGVPAPVDLTFHFGDPTAFIGSPISRELVEFGFRATVLNRPPGSGVDNTTFNGNLRLTYTYNAAAVPEPASLLTLGVGVLALLGLGWRG